LATLKSTAATPQSKYFEQFSGGWPSRRARGETGQVVNGTPIPIGNLTIFSPVFQREHDNQFNTDYTRGKHQIGTRFTFNQEKFIFQ